jgi:hypothetical protein
VLAKNVLKAALEYYKKKRVQGVIRALDASLSPKEAMIVFEQIEASKIDRIVYAINSGSAELNLNELIGILDKYEDSIIGYIGNDAVLDNCRLNIVNADTKKNNVSWCWHHDGCGRRLKMFICLEGDGAQPTFLASGYREKPYRYSLIDALRIINPRLGWRPKEEDIVALNHRRGSVSIFDTDILHRGHFNSVASRHCLVLEFCSLKKIRLIGKFCPVGPTSDGSEITFSSELIKSFKRNRILSNTAKFLEENRGHV